MECEKIDQPLISSNSTQLSNVSNQDIKHEVSISSGLPNIMNTCFLNSILQQLYQIAIINYFLSGQGQAIDVDQDQDLQVCLKALFKMMGDNAPANQKRLALVKIRNHLTKMLLDYEAGSQYDSFETFTCIFDYLSQRIPRLYQYFEMEYNQSCGCPYEAMNFAATNIQGHKIMCLQCKSQIKRQFVTFPAYLVVNYEKGNHEGEMPSRLQSDGWYYTLQSRNIYNGSGRFGHYYSECLYKGNFYTFDDNSKVRLSQKDQRNKCLFAIYKRNMKENDANSLKLKKIPIEQTCKAKFTRKNTGKGKQQVKGRGSNKARHERIIRRKPSASRQKLIIKTNSVKLDKAIYLNEEYIKRATRSSCYLYIRSMLPAQLKIYLEKIYQYIRSKILAGISHLVLRTRPIWKGKDGVFKKIEIIEMS